jgi:hypothetical protein
VVLALLALGLVATALLLSVLLHAGARGKARRARSRHRRRGRAGFEPGDPGRERRAEQRARELLRSCVNDEEWAMYRDLGFISVPGRLAGARTLDGEPSRADRRGSEPPYAYLIYPHKPIVAYVPQTRRLLSEYCVEFPDLTGAISDTRLPDSDDVLAKWMAVTGDESRLLRNANMHLPGRQVDPARIRRDLWRLAEWERQRGGPDSAELSSR